MRTRLDCSRRVHQHRIMGQEYHSVGDFVAETNMTLVVTTIIQCNIPASEREIKMRTGKVVFNLADRPLSLNWDIRYEDSLEFIVGQFDIYYSLVAHEWWMMFQRRSFSDKYDLVVFVGDVETMKADLLTICLYA